MSFPRPQVPGFPAAGHISSRGYWHPGSVHSCGTCPGATRTTGWKCHRNPAHPTQPHPLFGWFRCTVCGAAQPYAERRQMVPDSLTLGVFVPAGDNTVAASMIRPGSGIVGMREHHQGGPRINVHFEGWIHGQHHDATPMQRWELGVRHAAGRLTVDYPTIAKATLPADELELIGHHSPATDTLRILDLERVGTWIQ